MKTKLLIPVLVIAVFLIVSVPLYASAASVTIDVSAAATYQGAVNVNGKVIPNPGSNQEVDIAVNNPNGVNVLNSVVPIDGSTGSFTYSSPTGGSSAWINGTYTVTVTWGTLTATYKNQTTFQYGTISTSSTSSSSTQSTTATTTVTTTVTTTAVSTTTSVQTVSTTVTSSTTVTTTSTVTNSTWEYIGIAGIAAAIVLAGVAVFMMRRS